MNCRASLCTAGRRCTERYTRKLLLRTPAKEKAGGPLSGIPLSDHPPLVPFEPHSVARQEFALLLRLRRHRPHRLPGVLGALALQELRVVGGRAVVSLLELLLLSQRPQLLLEEGVDGGALPTDQQ